jgi:hypothetical protein
LRIVLGHLDKLLRPLVIGRLGRFGDEAIIAEARKRFDAHVSGKTLIPADLRSPVYRTVLSVGDEATYSTMLKVSYCQKFVIILFLMYSPVACTSEGKMPLQCKGCFINFEFY